MSEEKRTRRTPEQMAQARDEKIAQLEATITEIEKKKLAAISAYDEKIAAVQIKIETLKAHKEKKKPGRKPAKKRRSQAERIKEIVRLASKAGLSPDEIAHKLGVQTE